MPNTFARLFTLVLAAYFLVGCAGGYNSLDDAIAGEDCEVTQHSTEKWFTTDEVHCEDGTIISWHANEIDRNAYKSFIEGAFDVTPAVEGDRYLIYR